ncbi:MAG: hypothetical protein ACOYJ2_00895 [Rickettsiales bacterium]
MKNYIAAILCFSSLLFASTSFAIDSSDTNPNSRLAWEAVNETGKDIFPSFILSTENVETKKDDEYYGDPNALLKIKIENLNKDEELEASIKVDAFSTKSKWKGSVKKSDRPIFIAPVIKWDRKSLLSVKEPETVSVEFSLKQGKQSETIVKKYRLRSINDALFAAKVDGRVVDTPFFFAAYVNENSPLIEKILSEALEYRAVPSFIGYQGTTRDVERQIFAVWNTMQRHDIRYSSITQPSGENKDFISQHVRSVDESFENKQANCIDGTVLMASVLYKIGLCPSIVIMPGHALLGVNMSQESCNTDKNMAFIETTMVGRNPPLNGFQKAWKFKTNDGYLNSVSYKSLRNAMRAGHKKVSDNFREVKLIHISKAREIGITPINSGK